MRICTYLLGQVSVAVAVLACALMAPTSASAFCGFYVGGADTKLYNDATQVVMMREGTTTVLSMQNKYEGPAENFAMVVPVPEVLQKENVKILDKSVFDKVDTLSAPRLVEYWEQDPCGMGVRYDRGISLGSVGTAGRGGGGYGKGSGLGVTVEAEFKVGEYDIVILSAKEATGLETWLGLNRYVIPAGAAPFFKPYIESGSYFFVAKVDVTKAKYEKGSAVLSPLRFHYTDKEFRLPVRLGLINSRGTQDLLVYILAENQRYEVANYPNVLIPTNLEVANEVRDSFGGFYEALASRTFEENPKAVITEYSWPSGSCDPCPAGATGALSRSQIHTLGGDVFSGKAGDEVPLPKARIGDVKVKSGAPKEVVRRIARRRQRVLRHCYQMGLSANPKLKGKVTINMSYDPAGGVKKARVAATELGNAAVEKCLLSRVRSWRFPESKDGKSGSFALPIVFTSTLGAPRFGGRKQYVLTRLHARYDANTLGEDLVFKLADPVVGGREYDQKGAGPAVGGSRNQFQGRYIIRHEWEGPIECDNPNRGVWGGPPKGGSAQTSAAASQNTTGKKPGPVDLKALLRTESSAAKPALGADSPVPTPAKAESDPPEAAKAAATTSKPASEPASGCTTGTPGASSWGFVVVFGMLLGWRTRRRKPTSA